MKKLLPGLISTLCSLLMLLLLAACAPPQQAMPATNPPAVKVLATAVVSPTPNAEQAQATRLASSPTPAPPSPSPIPTETPYVGLFLGRANREGGLPMLSESFFQPDQAFSALPTANAARCGIPIEFSYIAAWRNNNRVSDRMGCPIQQGFGFFGEAQVFEEGIMYRRPETRDTWAIVSRGQLGQYWYLEAPPTLSTVGLPVPQGFTLPGGDFGSLWMAVDVLREQIGYAQTAPQEVAMGLQRFDGGSFLLDASAGQVFALLVDGTVYGPFSAPDQAPAPIITPIILPDAPDGDADPEAPPESEEGAG